MGVADVATCPAEGRCCSRARDRRGRDARHPARLGAGRQLAPATLELWHQDWPPINAAYQSLKAAVETAQPNITITLTPLPYEQLLAQILPSVAAGEEPELMNVYSSWLVGSDIESLFTPVAPEIMTTEEAEALFYSAALGEGLRGESLYYLPFLNGMGGSTFTYNPAHLEEKGIDPASIVDVAGPRRRRQGAGRLGGRRAQALGHRVQPLHLVGLGDRHPPAGRFVLRSGERASSTSPALRRSRRIKLIDDLLKVHRVDDILKAAPSHADMNSAYGGPGGFPQGLAAITNFGSWIVSSDDPTANPGLEAGVFAMPKMGDATEEIELSHNAVHVLSRKLLEDDAKRAAARFFISQFADPALFLPLTDIYGGSVIIPSVAEDPAVLERRWGSIQQQYDQLDLAARRVRGAPHPRLEHHGGVAVPVPDLQGQRAV